MKLLRALPALFFFTVCAALADDQAPQPELRGIVTAGGTPRFALAVPGGKQAWVTVGDIFEGWKLSEYDSANDTLVLTKDGHTTTLPLSSSVVGVSATGAVAGPTTESTRATLADAEEVLNRMKFDQMISQMLKAQKDTMAKMAKVLAAQAAGSSGPTAEEQAFQAKLMDAVYGELNADSMHDDIARVYSEVYSKEELQAMANFYGTSAGQAMVDKQPEVAARTQAAMLPRLLAASSKAQQMAKDFAAEQATRKVAPAAAK